MIDWCRTLDTGILALSRPLPAMKRYASLGVLTDDTSVTAPPPRNLSRAGRASTETASRSTNARIMNRAMDVSSATRGSFGLQTVAAAATYTCKVNSRAEGFLRDFAIVVKKPFWANLTSIDLAPGPPSYSYRIHVVGRQHFDLCARFPAPESQMLQDLGICKGCRLGCNGDGGALATRVNAQRGKINTGNLIFTVSSVRSSSEIIPCNRRVPIDSDLGT